VALELAAARAQLPQLRMTLPPATVSRILRAGKSAEDMQQDVLSILQERKVPFNVGSRLAGLGYGSTYLHMKEAFINDVVESVVVACHRSMYPTKGRDDELRRAAEIVAIDAWGHTRHAPEHRLAVSAEVLVEILGSQTCMSAQIREVALQMLSSLPQ
jgi:hypothetical protein